MNDYINDAISLIEMEYMEVNDDLAKINESLTHYRQIIMKLQKKKRSLEGEVAEGKRKLAICYNRKEWMRSPRYANQGNYGIDREVIDILP